MFNQYKKKLRKSKSLILISFLGLLSLSLMGCGSPNIDEAEVAAEAYNRFPGVLDKASWTNLNYEPADFSASLDDKEITIQIRTSGFYNFVEGIEQNYSYYRNIGIYTLEENGKYLFEQDEKLDSIRVVLWSSGSNKYGKEVALENLVLSLERGTFEKIDWEGLKMKMIFGNLDTSIFKEAYIRGS